MSLFDWKGEWKALLLIVTAVIACFYLPVNSERFQGATREALAMVNEYAQLHVVLCLVPALFIAGAIGVFVSQASVMKYLGPKANKPLAYGVASVSGTILAVCSCTVLPLFAGIYRMGAGLGPASAFLYSGPAINVLAIVLTARVMGLRLGLARAIGAIAFSVIIGLIMHVVYRKEEQAKVEAAEGTPEPEVKRPLWQNAGFFAAMVGILVFANWGKGDDNAFWNTVHSLKWYITTGFAILLGLILVKWFGLEMWRTFGVAVVTGIVGVATHSALLTFVVGVAGLSFITSIDKGEGGDWFAATWGFTKQILPLLLGGVLVAGLLLGRPGHEALIPSEWIARAVGGNSVWANFFASFAGALMYFATLTEVPIVQGLIGSGMGQGPALALLLAGPALSLPSMIVLRSIMGTQKMLVYVSLVVVMATITGMIYGTFVS
jgi:uncharacterized protein